MKKITLGIILLFTIMTPRHIHANTLSTSITGTTNVTAGTRFTLTFAVTNAKDAQGIQTIINYDTNHFSIVGTPANLISNSAGGYTLATNRYDASWLEYKSGLISFLRIEFQTRPNFTPGTNSTISMSTTRIAQGNPPLQFNGAPNSVTITSVAPKSTTNTLSSISINGTNLSGFSASTTNYTLPDTQTTSISIGAVRTDSKSTLSGTGTFPLEYGNNRFVLTVRSESGSNRTYTINVPRPDLRGDDTSIKSITIGDHTLEWNTDDVTQNILLIPNTVSQADINVLLNEISAKVTSSLSQSFVVGENSIEITVQSEKGTVTTYPVMIVRADDQNVFPSKYTSTDIEKVLIDDVEYTLNEDIVRLPYNIEAPLLSILPVSSLTKVAITEVGSLVFGDNNITVTLTAFDGSVRTVVINLFRENQMNPVPFSELLENIDSYPIDTLSFFYEGLVIEEDILSKLTASNKSFRIYVQTPSVLGFWFLSSQDSSLLRDIDFSIEEDLTLDFQKDLDYIVQTNILFKETNFVKPIAFTFTQLEKLSLFDALYGYQMTEDGLQLIETWNVLPLSSTIEVGGPLHLVITPAQFSEGVSELDSRYLLALVIGVAAGWLLLLLSMFNNFRLKKRIKKLKKEIIK